MIFEIDWSTQGAPVTSRCSVPGIIHVPGACQSILQAQWLIVTRHQEWWSFGKDGLKGPHVAGTAALKFPVRWKGPVLMSSESTKGAPPDPKPHQSSRWTLSLDSNSHDFSGPILIGRNRLCSVRIQSPTVSGIHGLLYPCENSIIYFDLATRNGSYDSRGARISIARLLKNDSLQVGDKVLQLAQEGAGSDKPVVSLCSAEMLELERVVEKVAPSTAPVVIYGESGVGKELVAKSIHRRSGLHGPLVAANAACFTPQLARSELFGHVAGAFTGASADRQGLFSAAHSGTLFLDEIAEMPLSVQAELLRAIETGLIHPLGASGPRVAQPRLIIASHKNLDAEVRAGRFRQDLYYRLCVVKLTIPPLRERPKDIEDLAQNFTAEFCKGHTLTSDVLQWLKVQPWNGNVRELRNLFWRASVLCPQRPTQLFNLKHLLHGNQSSRVVREDVIRVFFELGQDVQETAKALQLHRSTVHRHIKEYRSHLPEAA